MKRKFDVITDSACDMPKNYLVEKEIECIDLGFTMNNVNYEGEYGEKIYWLGRAYETRTVISRREGMLVSEDTLIFLVKEDTKERMEKVFLAAAKERMERFMEDLRGQWDSRICDANRIDYPVIKIRNMKSRWGSCSMQKKEIHMSLQLIHYPPQCIDAVLLHEYAHLLVPNHSKAFYAIVLRHMPQYWQIHSLLKTQL
jgi:predicted metal-dependent hydrolase